MKMPSGDVYLSAIQRSDASAKLEGDALVAVDVYARPVEMAELATPNNSDPPFMRVGVEGEKTHRAEI